MPQAPQPGDTPPEDSQVEPTATALVSRRALAEIVRDAVLGSYGVTRLQEPTRLWRLRSALHLGSGAVRVSLRPDVTVDVWVTVAYGLPVAEVARQIDSAVRYGLRRALGRDVGPISIHVEGLAGRAYVSQPGVPAPDAPGAEGMVGPADSGDAPTDQPQEAERPEGSAGPVGPA